MIAEGHRGICACVLATLGVATPAVAQSRSTRDTSASTPVVLQAVVDAAIAGNSQIRADWLKVENFRGQLLAKAAPFDLQVHTAVERRHDNPQLTTTQLVGEQATNYEVSVSRQLRSGITLTPSVQVTRSQFALPGATATGLSNVGVSAAIPLMFDRGGAVTAGAERVAQYDLEGVRGGWRTSVMVNVNSTIDNYWDYVAAQARLSVQREAEGRAQQLLDETAELVKSDERAPADLQQLRANLAAKRGARILAEQAVVQARVQLGTSMGLDAPAIESLGAPGTDFPTPPKDAVSSAASIPRLLDLARAHRPDLAAARVEVHAWGLELEEFRSAALPRLDLTMTVGYQGLTSAPGVNPLVAPLYRNVPSLNATIGVRYDAAVGNSAARGQLAQEAASVAQQRLSLRDIERQVVTDVQTAAVGLDRSVLALRESQAAVELFRQTVDNEKRKLQLGMSTLFDVINAEDALTNALLTDINDRRAYALSLASLRAATGTLVDVQDDAARVDAARLLSAP